MSTAKNTNATLSPDLAELKTKEFPKKYEGYVSKRRKWPLKGWHKRYFLLDRGFLKYSKSPADIAKGKYHGLMDVGLCVMSTKKKSCRIDLDAEDTIFHIKIKGVELFKQWIKHLRAHREFRQTEHKNDTTLKADSSDAYNILSPTSQTINDMRMFSEPASSVDEVTTDLLQAKRDIELMKKLLADIRSSPATTPTGKLPTNGLSKKERKMSKKISKKNAKSSSTASSTGAAIAELSSHIAADSVKIPINFPQPGALNNGGVDRLNLSKSNPDLMSVNKDVQSHNLCTNISSHSVHSTPARTSQHIPSFAIHNLDDDSNNNFHKLPYNNQQFMFIEYASRVCQSLESSLLSIENISNTKQPTQDKMYKLLNKLHFENKEMKMKLQRIHQESSSVSGVSPANTLNLKLNNQMPAESFLSISEGMSECFYDAEEYLISDDESSSDGEESDAQSTDSQMSETLESTESIPNMSFENVKVPKSNTGRRKALPCFRPEGGDFSLWNILKKNIGKDLSKVSMPVTMNEPLNALQLLCEGMEYSELLDQAVVCDDMHERMVLVAAFAVSSYGSTKTRAGQKPFNPILGETYECIREDKGFKFFAEQVSHHPPISACHCKAESYEFYQDARWKNKFWGKSMEILPMGKLHLNIPKYGDHYTWNKVTTCVHNIVSGTRWVEHYGEMKITNKDITCKITFSKNGYWSNKNGEFSGKVTDGNGVERHHVHGTWHEGFYLGHGSKSRSVWRPAPMPADYDKYYGFSQFAMELNELDPLESDILPRTDTRFRPDQRALEEGDIDSAEQQKQHLEQMQRERRKEREESGEQYHPIFFKKLSNGDEDDIWMSKHNYWALRNSNGGFQNLKNLPKLW